MGRFTEILNNSAPTGSVIDVNIVNGSISVDVTVTDYVSVTQSGAFITTLGSQAITNWPTSYNGSVYQATNPWIILGSVNVANQGYLGSTFYLSGLQDVAGSIVITNNVAMTGSVVQSTSPWIVLGSQAITNNVAITGSVAVTNTVNVNNWLGSKEYKAVLAGSPANTVAFTQLVKKVILTTSVGSMFSAFDLAAEEGVGVYMPTFTTNSFDMPCGSVSAYSTAGNGSLNIIGLY